MTQGGSSGLSPEVAAVAGRWDVASEPLVAVTRGDAVESVHRGVLVVADVAGRVVGGLGDPEAPVLLRSVAKPFQALALLQSGAAERWALTDEELAVICASHSGSPEHLALVSGILQRIGLDPSWLSCGPQLPFDAAARRELAARGEKGTPLHNTCSGKHAGMLALARHLGLDPAGYERPEHGVQRVIRETVAGLVGHDRDLWDGTDGCGVPVFRTSAREAAGLFARLAAGEGQLARLRDAMMAHPVLVAGAGRLDTAVMSALPGRLVAKGGAEGIQSLGVETEGFRSALGCLIKVEDGSSRPLPVLVASVLGALAGEAAGASALGERDRLLLDTNGRAVGALVPLILDSDVVRQPSPHGGGRGASGRGDPVAERLRISDATGNERDVVRFLQEQWPPADEAILGRAYDWRVQPFVLVARWADSVAGVLRARLVGGVATVEELLVHGDLRGRGVGRALLRLAEQRARQEGCHKVELHAVHGAPSEGFYRHLGYTRESLLPRYHFGHDFVCMVRELDGEKEDGPDGPPSPPSATGTRS